MSRTLQQVRVLEVPPIRSLRQERTSIALHSTPELVLWSDKPGTSSGRKEGQR